MSTILILKTFFHQILIRLSREVLSFNLLTNSFQSRFIKSGKYQPIEVSSYTHLWDLLCQRVDLASLSEQPLSVALSSGFDSSLIAIILRYQLGIHINTFTLSNSLLSDESSIAKVTADKLNSNHTTISVAENDIHSFLDDYPAFDKPIGDLSQLGYHLICKELRSRHLKVLLWGNGLDEFFWGYPWVRALSNTCSMFNQLSSVPIPFSLFKGSPVFKSLRNDYMKLFPSQLSNFIPYDYCHNSSDVKNAISKLYLVENGLIQTDNIGMFSSIESRSPFANQYLNSIHFTGSLSNLSKQSLLQGLFTHVDELSDFSHLLYRKKLGFNVNSRLIMRCLTDRFLNNTLQSDFYALIDDTFGMSMNPLYRTLNDRTLSLMYFFFIFVSRL